MEKDINGVVHIPLDEAAGGLGTTPLRILTLIGQGVMKGCQVEEEWFVDKGTLKCFRVFQETTTKSSGCGGACSSGGCSGGN